jgi:biopolymer transport protein ExbD
MAASYSDDEEAMSAINATPLVDVTLVLLIVFMITVPAIVGSARVKVDLPETTAVEADSEMIPLVFSLKLENGKQVLYLNEDPIDEAGVRDKFKGWGKPNDDQQVSLAADKGIAYGDVMKVVNLLESLGLRKLALDTKHVETR